MSECSKGLLDGFARRVLLCWLLVGCAATVTPPSANGSSLRMTPIVKAVQGARPSVVNIRGEKTVNANNVTAAEGEAGHQVNGMGTGVVIDPRGYVITNYHVIDGVREIQVTLADGRQYIGRPIAREPETDLAVIKIDVPDKLPVLRIGRSTDLMIGETVIAVGNAYGYEHTVTEGIISALHRAVQVSDAQFYDDLIQTDASINPGNSGGPLLNIDGELIGINVAVRAGAQGIGFAIPIDKALEVVSKLLTARNVQGIRHGLVLQKKAESDADGVLVVSIQKGSPAAEAGIKPGDVITRIDDFDLAGPLDFERSLLERTPGERLRVALRREETQMHIDLKLAAASVPPRVASPTWDLLGMELKEIPDEQFRRSYKIRNRGGVAYHGGLAVVSVRPDSPAAKQGIHAGDVLVGMHVWETVSLKDVTYILDKRPDVIARGQMKFYILRDGNTLYGYFSLASTKPDPQR